MVRFIQIFFTFFIFKVAIENNSQSANISIESTFLASLFAYAMYLIYRWLNYNIKFRKAFNKTTLTKAQVDYNFESLNKVKLLDYYLIRSENDFRIIKENYIILKYDKSLQSLYINYGYLNEKCFDVSEIEYFSYSLSMRNKPTLSKHCSAYISTHNYYLKLIHKEKLIKLFTHRITGYNGKAQRGLNVCQMICRELNVQIKAIKPFNE